MIHTYSSPDVALGMVALGHGDSLASGRISMSEVTSAMMYALDDNGGLWRHIRLVPDSEGERHDKTRPKGHCEYRRCFLLVLIADYKLRWIDNEPDATTHAAL